MPVISDTAYPHLPPEPGTAELEAFTSAAAELAFARQRTRQPGPRLALLVLLKVLRRLGYAVRLADVLATLVAHVAASAGLAAAASEIAGYDDTSYRVRPLALVQGFIGVASYNREARAMVARACIGAAHTRDDLADIVNAGVEPGGLPDIEELLRCRRELPAFRTLLKLAHSARALFKRHFTTRTDALPWLFISERGQPLADHSVNCLIGAAAGQAGLPDVHPRTLRHSCGFAPANKGYDLRLTQDYLGHRDPRHTAHYTRTAGRRFEGLWR